jgi:DNA-binding response OmpR family regulator
VSRVSSGDFALDLDWRELRRGRHAVSLAPDAYQLLEILVTNHLFGERLALTVVWPVELAAAGPARLPCR